MVSFIALLILHSLFINLSCYATDTITHNSILKDGDIVVSNGGIYALGFFSPGESKLRYVGIWYNKIPEQALVWVANRNNPIRSSSIGVAKVDEQGNLGIFNGNASDPVWSTNLSIPDSNKISSLFYKLLDSGNLVLCDEQNRADILWQSFDYPTNAQLPGTKIGFNLKSGLNWSLTSWKSPEDPSTGDFTHSMSQTESPEVVLKKGSQKIWRTGPWNGQAWNGIPKMSRNYIFNYSFVNNPDEVYFIYTIYNASILFYLFVDYLGIIKQPTWVVQTHRWNDLRDYPGDRCEYYGKCGAFGTCNINNAFICSCLPGFEPKSPGDWYIADESQGCVRKRELLCGEGDGFLKLEKVKLPDTSNARVDMSLGIEDCKIKCRSNCSCTGYASAYVDGSGCLTWYGELIDIREFTEGGQDLFVRVDAIELENSMRHSKGRSLAKKKVLLLCVLSVVGFLIFISAFCYLFKRVKKRGLLQREKIRKQELSSPCLPPSKTNKETSVRFELPIFDLNSILIATENFSDANKLGEGGFGLVYKGKLFDGCEIAVKRLSKNSGQGAIEFKNEVELIAKLQHLNLVQIIGCCIEEEEKILISEYLPNKSLDILLFDQTRSVQLDWKMRHDIILGIARGVLYLHQDSRLKIIHRDLKASNILLDANMDPKISDFGMARIFGGDQSQAITRRVVGTYGYMSPEYAMDGFFSIKSDVFSFGVLLLEIISGKRNSGFYHEDPTMNLIKHTWELWKDGKILELADSSMDDSFPEQEVVRFIQVGILCVQENAKDRPTMSDVIFMLRNETPIPPLKQPAFVLINNQNSSKTSAGSAPSVNKMSITIVEGR